MPRCTAMIKNSTVGHRNITDQGIIYFDNTVDYDKKVSTGVFNLFIDSNTITLDIESETTALKIKVKDSKELDIFIDNLLRYRQSLQKRPPNFSLHYR